MESGSSINWKAFAYYEALKQVHNYCLKYPGKPLSLASAAHLAALEPAYFSRFFHRKTGVTFKYWIDFMRIQYASNLLRTSNKTIIDVVEECEFRDATTFTRTFRRITGVTPIAFRRNVLQQVDGLLTDTPKSQDSNAKEKQVSFAQVAAVRAKMKAVYARLVKARGDFPRQMELHRRYIQLQQQWDRAVQKYREAQKRFAQDLAMLYFEIPADSENS